MFVAQVAVIAVKMDARIANAQTAIVLKIVERLVVLMSNLVVPNRLDLLIFSQ
uniref:Transposase n=1 Tax=Meloidogyne hapla TaxID=6305 RepID=A0A1I8B364_MELHA